MFKHHLISFIPCGSVYDRFKHTFKINTYQFPLTHIRQSITHHHLHVSNILLLTERLNKLSLQTHITIAKPEAVTLFRSFSKISPIIPSIMPIFLLIIFVIQSRYLLWSTYFSNPPGTIKFCMNYMNDNSIANGYGCGHSVSYSSS